MKEIKSLADELRETIRINTEVEGQGNRKNERLTAKSVRKMPAEGKGKSIESVNALFEQILSHELTGKEKQMIRLDDRTVFLLKQLKVSQGIDMNKFVSFALQHFFQSKPELIGYIKASLKSVEL